jgi:serine/threonine-protein kinase
MKTILAGSMDDTNLEQMFLEEASLASQVHHPNVVEILDLGEHEGTLYLVMEWVDGESLQLVLKQMVGRGPLPFSIAVNIVGQACKGLHEAHELRDSSGQLVGLVHRDVSPHNILLSYSGVVKIVDFGIAKATNKNSGLTEEGHVKGKSAFMSPEQMRSKPIDRRADIFAMGIVLYLVTTGKHPFRGQDAIQTMRNVCEKPPLPPGSLVKDYPAKLSEVLMRALSKDPSRRFSTAHDMLSALEDAVPGCLEASFERDVSNFLSGLFGDRAAQRRAALAEAQEHADRVLELEGGSTQRAWLAGGTRGSSRVKLPSDEFGFARGLRRKHALAIAGAAATLLVGAGVLALRSGSKDETERASAPASVRAPSEPANATSPVPRETATSLEVPEPPPDSNAPKSEKRKVARHVGLPRTAAVSTGGSVAAPTPSPAPAAVRASAEPSAKPSQSAKPSAWDPNAFGGRH